MVKQAKVPSFIQNDFLKQKTTTTFEKVATMYPFLATQYN